MFGAVDVNNRLSYQVDGEKCVMQIGLVDVMRAVGIEPDGIVGHSVGELGCSYMDGCFTAEQMLLAAYYRGRASVETELVKGLMAAVGKFTGC
jgi:fatty acid synthase